MSDDVIRWALKCPEDALASLEAMDQQDNVEGVAHRAWLREKLGRAQTDNLKLVAFFVASRFSGEVVLSDLVHHHAYIVLETGTCLEACLTSLQGPDTEWPGENAPGMVTLSMLPANPTDLVGHRSVTVAGLCAVLRF